MKSQLHRITVGGRIIALDVTPIKTEGLHECLDAIKKKKGTFNYSNWNTIHCFSASEIAHFEVTPSPTDDVGLTPFTNQDDGLFEFWIEN